MFYYTSLTYLTTTPTRRDSFLRLAMRLGVVLAAVPPMRQGATLELLIR